MNDLNQQVFRNILKDKVRRAIFCQHVSGCGRALDVRNAVVLISEKRSGVLCGKCFAPEKDRNFARMQIQIINGKELTAAN